MINYPLKIKITFKSFADLNYRIFKDGNELSYDIAEDDSAQSPRYKITSSTVEEKALFEILYEILHELDLAPAELAKTVIPIHSEIVLNGGNEFTFYQIKENIYSWEYTRH
ncbi:MAG TPA: hypothetical protein VL443_19090 [Cyclobacteriaceae bacterium]|nr:hypothetical protein [Cyclobacteriaceae bacterium]